MPLSLPASWLWLIPLAPLAGAAILGLMSLVSSRSAQGASRGLAATIAVGAALLSAIVSLKALFGVASLEHNIQLQAAGWSWFTLGSFELHLGLVVDRLSAFMLLFITGIGTLIHIYSIGYMAHDRGFVRFMAYLNLFLASMITLVMADSLPLCFLGWEGVGLCSYLLIGFWHNDDENSAAANKAFIANRVGDLGFLLGAIVLVVAMGDQASLSFQAINAWIPGAQDHGLLLIASLLFIVACTGKSAQIPLFTWLPDAMAGPTPVSALIHAATMVTAGVYLCARLSPLVVATPAAMTVILILGCATALYAAICGLMQWDIKKVLAYSTVSQLGFMFMAVGVGAFDVALFHVFTHAFFKAALFLGAGSVIHALHHEQDMRRMGGLSKRLPATHMACLFGWWAICGLPLGAGFFSKDLILERLSAAGGFATVIWLLALVAAALTALYMTRMMYYVFWSPSRVEHADHVHEAPLTMTAPVVLLGMGALGAGAVWAPLLQAIVHPLVPLPESVQIGDDVHTAKSFDVSTWLEPVLGTAQAQVQHQAEMVDHSIVHHLLAALPGTLAAVIGLILALVLFRRGPQSSVVAPLSGVSALWTFFFDRVYDLLIRQPILICGRWLDVLVELRAVPACIGGVVWVWQQLGAGFRSFQRPQAQVNLAISVLGLLLILAVLISSMLGA